MCPPTSRTAFRLCFCLHRIPVLLLPAPHSGFAFACTAFGFAFACVAVGFLLLGGAAVHRCDHLLDLS